REGGRPAGAPPASFGHAPGPARRGGRAGLPRTVARSPRPPAGLRHAVNLADRGAAPRRPAPPPRRRRSRRRPRRSGRRHGRDRMADGLAAGWWATTGSSPRPWRAACNRDGGVLGHLDPIRVSPARPPPPARAGSGSRPDLPGRADPGARSARRALRCFLPVPTPTNWEGTGRLAVPGGHAREPRRGGQAVRAWRGSDVQHVTGARPATGRRDEGAAVAVQADANAIAAYPGALAPPEDDTLCAAPDSARP